MEETNYPGIVDKMDEYWKRVYSHIDMNDVPKISQMCRELGAVERKLFDLRDHLTLLMDWISVNADHINLTTYVAVHDALEGIRADIDNVMKKVRDMRTVLLATGINPSNC